MTREELIKRIKETAYLEGDFILRSGKRSKYYLDKYLFETCPDILKALGEEFARYITNDVTLIAGAELGGVALELQRKAHGSYPQAMFHCALKELTQLRGYKHRS